jgi:hypothetical protein
MVIAAGTFLNCQIVSCFADMKVVKTDGVVSRLHIAERDAIRYLGHALSQGRLQRLHLVARALPPLTLRPQRPLHQRLLCRPTLDVVISTKPHLEV